MIAATVFATGGLLHIVAAVLIGPSSPIWRHGHSSCCSANTAGSVLRQGCTSRERNSVGRRERAGPAHVRSPGRHRRIVCAGESTACATAIVGVSRRPERAARTYRRTRRSRRRTPRSRSRHVPGFGRYPHLPARLLTGPHHQPSRASMIPAVRRLPRRLPDSRSSKLSPHQWGLNRRVMPEHVPASGGVSPTTTRSAASTRIAHSSPAARFTSQLCWRRFKLDAAGPDGTSGRRHCRIINSEGCSGTVSVVDRRLSA